MQKFQQLIHQAFAKIDASDPQMRQKVYENIWLIQEKSLIAQNTDNEQKQEKRRHLTELLKAAEKQYRLTQAEAAGSGEHGQKQHAPLPPEMPPAIEPQKTAEAAQSTASPPNNRAAAVNNREKEQKNDSSLYYLEQEVNRKVAKKSDKTAPSLLKKARSGGYIIGILAVFVAVFVAWSFYNSFGRPGAAKKQTALSTAPAQQNDYGKNGWVEVFNPANVAGLDVQGTASADLHNEPDADFIRLTSYKADDAAIIEIGQGALIPLQGKTATFKLVARNGDNAIGQLNLMADFGNGAVTHYRFELSPTVTPLLFRLPVPQKLSKAAQFYIGGDAAGKPCQMDIFSLLVRESDQAGH
ncbi:MAG: hypothetical protein DU429_03325 [Candidatus Tokpelaia sp.]|uniref:hypothetical protein n=1 Tax=Candidatus Tokpelaia sp. TaxID=2233777 RepID=UPI00123AF3DF|nr:hypothetical protein [Candidatus Tokpelaia sp.]KAA6206384.1 MAG: hypothetical protein DU430_01185 [Candidatus Tokpelaia sp.]KAA6207146.1 MAG: hypothetical protein DU429_03325 [Candidatus Tokpelaia sp.]KAA6405963.1 hypothetical protein DPQ22_02095 [Candidatus Tokpelaia sp.]